MRHLDLFSGIGGFALAASRVWPNHEVISFCDIEPFAQKVLKKHWPDVPCHDDIKTMKGSDYANIDLLTGGFPCQPFSTAGQRRGSEDDRHLWPEMLRVIREAKPRWIVGENVLGLVNWNEGLVFEEVFSDLEAAGYETQPFILPACAINAPHKRTRVWFIANTTKERWKESRRTPKPGDAHKHIISNARENANNVKAGSMAKDQFIMGEEGQKNRVNIRSEHLRTYKFDEWQPERDVETQAAFLREDDGISGWVDRVGGLGNAIVPQVAEMIFRAIRESE